MKELDRLGRRVARAVVGSFFESTAPGWVTAAASEVARVLKHRAPKGRREEMARLFVQVFAEETGLEVRFPVKVDVREARR